MSDWLIGLVGSGAIAGLAYWKRSLSGSGALAAMVVGTVLYSLGNAAWFGTLIAFFITSSLLSKWKQKQKAAVESGYEKTGRRDAGQVFANGGLGVLLCLLNHVAPHPAWWLAFVGVMATVTADTWATEIGGLSKRPPRSILTGKIVPTGTSGGVSTAGLAATACGGLFIGCIAWVLSLPENSEGMILLAVTGLVAGTIGSLADSFLGAKWQVLHRCSVCEKELEARVHCGKPTLYARGWRWLNNDRVNLIASVIGGLAAIGMKSLLL
ncbi:MAG: DUF92 domain-containing protein [Tumebacillaceae bacterium]